MKKKPLDTDNFFNKTIGEGGEIISVSDFSIKPDGKLFSFQYVDQIRK